MKKSSIARTSLFVVLICAFSTCSLAAEAYSDLQSGYQVGLPAHHLQIAGQGFIYSADSGAMQSGLKNTEADFNMVLAVKPEHLQKWLGKKFTTRDFLKTYADVQLLERSNVDTHKAVSMLYAPENFLTAEPGFLPFDLLTKDNLTSGYKISSREDRTNKFIILSLESNDKTNKDDNNLAQENFRPPLKINVALTSKNNRLYALISAIPEVDQKKALENELKQHSVFKEKSIKDKYATENQTRQNYYRQAQDTFLNSFKIQEPLPGTTSLFLRDKLLNIKVPVPQDWFYTQYIADNDKTRSQISYLLPMATLKLMGDNLGSLTSNNYKALVQDSLAINFTDTLRTDRPNKFLDNMTEVISIISYQNKKEAAYAEYLKNSAETSKFFKTFFKNLEVDTEDNHGAFQARQREHQITVNPEQGLLILKSIYSYKDQEEFAYEAKVGFTKDKFGSIGYLHKLINKEKQTTDTEKLFQRLQLFSK